MSHTAHRFTLRAGYSLIELMVVIITVSVVVGATCTLLVAFTLTSDSATQWVEQQRTLSRLAEQLRQDIRAASKGTYDQVLILERPTAARIEYCRVPAGLERLVIATDGKNQQRELFRLPQQFACDWDVTQSAPQVVTLRIAEVSPETAQARRLVVRLSAVVGSDRRFDPQEGNQ